MRHRPVKAAPSRGIGYAGLACSCRNPAGKEGRAIKIPLQITFKNMTPSEAVEGHVRAAAEKLEEFCDHIMGCRVHIEVPHKHRHQGNAYHVRIDVTVPGEEFVIKRAPKLLTDSPTRFPQALDDVALERTRELSKHAVHDDFQLSIRDAFDAARRKLQDYVRRRRGSVKLHEGPAHARVSKLFPEEGFGFVETADGREIYFHRNSVLESGFASLDIGSEVHFAEEAGDKGPQASTVRLVTHHE